MQKLILLTLLLSMALRTALTQGQTPTTLREPESMEEFDSMLNFLLESQPFVYVITSEEMPTVKNPFQNRNDIEIWVKSFVTSDRTKDSFRQYLFLSPGSLGPADFVAGANISYRRIPQKFFFSVFKEEPIGNMSFELKFGIWKGDPTNRVIFVRGNCVIDVLSPKIGFRYKNNNADGKRDIELCKYPDPREIAWEIDQYLKGDPLEKLGETEKTERKRLEIMLPDESEFELGKEYPLDFPRKLPDGTVPAEIRLVVSRGEIQQISENPSLPPTLDGQFTVLFGQPGPQTVRCYHLDESGNCLAWGELEVNVKDE